MGTTDQSRTMFTIGIVLIVLGLLPTILPTTYFRISPLAAPVREHQRAAMSFCSCEVCGASATKKLVKPYKAIMNRSGQYVGYNPREWPGNSEILLCEKHLDCSDAAAVRRLSHSALLYLPFKGNNMWLRVVLVVHLAIFAGGCYSVFKWRSSQKSV